MIRRAHKITEKNNCARNIHVIRKGNAKEKGRRKSTGKHAKSVASVEASFENEINEAIGVLVTQIGRKSQYVNGFLSLVQCIVYSTNRN